jgi:hypothetical protein
LCSSRRTRTSSLPCGRARRRGRSTQEEGREACYWSSQELNGRFFVDVAYILLLFLLAASFFEDGFGSIPMFICFVCS